ncbi:type IV toxin-antitoxin system AbiEi family antitoxin domain-containing protein [Micromonospora sp. NPDC047134]|uniref:type IV toxin-antitoxin system AbiEi family antitoxin domain-containing protein n=1 Tax=Micromonospora sp. NPDC047134 TaxID=3154340 RepID=UPI0033D5DFD4
MLPATFSYSQALDAGFSEWQLYRLRDQGLIASVGRGLYRRVPGAGRTRLRRGAVAASSGWTMAL